MGVTFIASFASRDRPRQLYLFLSHPVILCRVLCPPFAPLLVPLRVLSRFSKPLQPRFRGPKPTLGLRNLKRARSVVTLASPDVCSPAVVALSRLWLAWLLHNTRVLLPHSGFRTLALPSLSSRRLDISDTKPNSSLDTHHNPHQMMTAPNADSSGLRPVRRRRSAPTAAAGTNRRAALMLKRQLFSFGPATTDPTTTDATTTDPTTTTTTPVATTTSPVATTTPPETTTTPPVFTTTTSAIPIPTTTASSSAAPRTTTAEASPDPSTTTAAATTARTTTPSLEPSTSRAPLTTTVVITPTTVIVVGSSTITSTLSPITSTAVQTGTSSGDSTSSGLSSGARVGIIVGSVVGGLAALAALVILCLVAKRRKQRQEDDAIRWPEIQDQANLYPQPVHSTGGAGVGGDEMEEVHPDFDRGAAGLGAGAAGVGAGAYAAHRYNSTSSHGGHSQQPTLPQVAPSIYSSEESPYSSYGATTPYSPHKNMFGSSGPSSNSGTPLAPGPASIEYQRAMAANNTSLGSEMRQGTPSPPIAPSSNDHGESSPHPHPVGSGVLPLPGSEMGHDEMERPSSPTDMQVGGPFGAGYDEGEGGRRWQLSVVNDDLRSERGY